MKNGKLEPIFVFFARKSDDTLMDIIGLKVANMIVFSFGICRNLVFLALGAKLCSSRLPKFPNKSRNAPFSRFFAGKPIEISSDLHLNLGDRMQPPCRVHAISEQLEDLSVSSM